MRKNYILDANILIHDPQSIFHFADNTVIIPVAVIEEIDRFKKEQTARGYNARAVVRLLDALRNGRSLAQGVQLDSGGLLRVHCESERALQRSTEGADIELLRVAQLIKDQQPDVPVVIVTKDINLRIRADAAGLRAEDYESDRVRVSELDSGQIELTLDAAQMDLFQSQGLLTGLAAPLPANEYVLLRSNGTAKHSSLGRVSSDGSRIQRLHEPDASLCGIKPRNKEQYFAIDALLDERIKLVTLMGRAGTGKTLLALAAAMHLSGKKRGGYRGTLVCRPIFPVGRDLGYLPGDLEQKLDPWMKPIADTVEFLLDSAGVVNGHRDVAALLRDGTIEIQPLTYIRGRSISNRFVIIDETQNLTPLEIKTVITRCGQASKVVLTGDPDQIDNPYVDSASNGFTYVVNRFRGQPIAAHVLLRKGERSELAELAATLL